MEDSANKKQIVLFGQLITVNDIVKVVATNFLPEHLVMEQILPRLPLKSVVRFKAVSKHWFSFISDPQFDELRKKLITPPRNFILIDVSDSPRPMFVLPFNERSGDVAKLNYVHCPEIENNYHDCALVRPCNGIVCLNVMNLDTFALWNPLTTHFQLFPRPLYSDDGTSDDDDYGEMNAYGFGYLSSADDYKVLCMYLSAEIGQVYVTRSYVFSLRSGEWTRLTHLEGPEYARLLEVEGFYLDDSLYWPNRTGSALGVVRFNLSDHQMRQLPETSWLRDYDQVEEMFDLRGDLSVCCRKSSREEWDLWVFQKKGTTKTWLKLYSIDTTNLSVLAFSDCGMFLARHSGRLKLLEITAPRNSDDLPMGVGYDGDIRYLCARCYDESLVDCRIKNVPPENLVMEQILPRLPLKSLARFKAVSKYWSTFISAPQFNEHRLKFTTPPPSFILLDTDFTFAYPMCVLSYNDESRDVAELDRVRCVELEIKPTDYTIISSCNGLVCLYIKDTDHFALWNPLTSHYQLLSHSLSDGEVGEYFSTEVCGFGYLSSTGDYKVFCMHMWHRRDGEKDHARFDVFSLRGGHWTRLTRLEGPKYARLLDGFNGSYVNDSLYWHKRIESGLGVFRFGLSSYKMKQLPGTHWLRDYNQIKKMFNFRGDLSLCCSKRSRDEWDLWVFQKKGIIRTWHKLYSIDTTIFSVLAFSHCGMLLAEHLGRLKLLEISALRNSDDLPEGVDFDGNIRELVACPHAESLVNCLIKKKP